MRGTFYETSVRVEVCSRTPRRLQVVGKYTGRLLYDGNAEQVHSWLAREGFVSAGFGEYVRGGAR